MYRYLFTFTHHRHHDVKGSVYLTAIGDRSARAKFVRIAPGAAQVRMTRLGEATE